MNSSIYSSIGRKASDTQKQNSISIDFHSVSSSCVTNKELKLINHYFSSINNSLSTKPYQFPRKETSSSVPSLM